MDELVRKSFAIEGGTFINATVKIKVIAEKDKSFSCWYPFTDGSFGDMETNIKGLSNIAFKAGIPIYFIGTSIEIASGQGILYNA